MPSYRATIRVMLKKSILDPQGKAVHHALESLQMKSVEDVRVGKLITLTFQADDNDAAGRIAGEACARLLANPVMEDYDFEIEQV